jgi:hypothetical protein
MDMRFLVGIDAPVGLFGCLLTGASSASTTRSPDRFAERRDISDARPVSIL